MRDALKSYLALAGGVTEVTRQRALAAAKALASQGEATAEQVQGLAEDLLQQSRANREALAAIVRFEVDRALSRVGLATAEEVEQLQAQVRRLEEQLRTGGAGDASGEAAPDAEPTPAKQAPAKRSAQEAAPAKQAAAKATGKQRAQAAPPAKQAPAKAAAKATGEQGAPAAAPAKKAAAKAPGKKAAPRGGAT